MCLCDTLVQVLHKLQAFMSERHELESFPDRIIFASMFNDITNWESQKVQSKCVAPANEVAVHASKFTPVTGVSLVQGRKRLGNTTSQDLLLNVAMGSVGQTRFGENKFIISKNPLLKCSNTLQTVTLT